MNTIYSETEKWIDSEIKNNKIYLQQGILYIQVHI